MYMDNRISATTKYSSFEPISIKWTGKIKNSAQPGYIIYYKTMNVELCK